MKTMAILILGSLFFLLQGCYTVLWTPNDDYEGYAEYYDEERDESREYDYYDEEYYGRYHHFHASPWWAPLLPIPTTSSGKFRTDNNAEPVRDEGTAGLRNSSGGRTNEGGRHGSEHIPSTSGSGNSSGNDNNFDLRKPAVNDSNTKNTNSSSGNNNSNNSGSNRRTDDGGRNNSGNKRGGR